MSNIKKVGTAVLGCGAISSVYLENLKKRFEIINLIACCDLDNNLSEAMARRYQIKNISLNEILQDNSIELVVNLTPPAAHYSIIKKLLLGGKNVYTEKMLCKNFEDAKELAALADEKHLLLCAAPDTFLGAGVQTAKFAVDNNLIGTVTSCVATLQRDGSLMAERFPYTAKNGGGIGLDVGIYYTTALLSILGKVNRVCGITATHQPLRTHFFVSHEDFGQEYRYESESLLCGVLQFKSGAVGTIHFNSNSIRCEKPGLTLYGTQGILYMPDPNLFGGEVKILAKNQTEPYVLPFTHGYSQNSRGLGVAEMAWSMKKGRTPRASKELALHAFEVLHGIIKSGETETFYQLNSQFDIPAPLNRGYFGEDYGFSEEEASIAF